MMNKIAQLRLCLFRQVIYRNNCCRKSFILVEIFLNNPQSLSPAHNCIPGGFFQVIKPARSLANAFIISSGLASVHVSNISEREETIRIAQSFTI
jgi:hypothetical protein